MRVIDDKPVSQARIDRMLSEDEDEGEEEDEDEEDEGACVWCGVVWVGWGGGLEGRWLTSYGRVCG